MQLILHNSILQFTTPLQDLRASLQEAAADVMNQSGFVYDERTGLYYDWNTGYYYDPVSWIYKITLNRHVNLWGWSHTEWAD